MDSASICSSLPPSCRSSPNLRKCRQSVIHCQRLSSNCRETKNHRTRTSYTKFGCATVTPRYAFSPQAVSRRDGSKLHGDVQFPSDYDELLRQAKEATELALEDGKRLLEIEVPTSGLESVPGDGEGGIEMTGSMQLIFEYCNCLIPPEKVTKTRIFLPEANEVAFARNYVFQGSSLKLDYLTKPSLFQDFGFSTNIKMVDRVKPEDEMFLVAYPYFNVNEMLVVEELYEEAIKGTDRKLIIFNGELDRIRSGYYPPFFYPKLGKLSKTFLPKLETIYYIHNFKGQRGGTLFRKVVLDGESKLIYLLTVGTSLSAHGLLTRFCCN